MKKIKILKNGRVMIINSFGQFTEELTPELLDQLLQLIFEEESDWKKLYAFYSTEEKQKQLEEKILKIKYEFEQKKYDDEKFNHQFDKLLEDKYAFKIFGSIFLFLMIIIILQICNIYLNYYFK